MEIDQSPSFREMRTSSMKRRRSPDGSPSPLERHPKRFTLAGDSDSLPSPTTPQHSFRGSASASTSRFSSEDWVKQADGLTIDGPLLSNIVSGVAFESNVNKQDRMDDSMIMDSEDSVSIYRPLLSTPRSAHRPNAPHIQITTSAPIKEASLPQFQFQAHSQQQNLFLSAPSMHVYPVSPHSDISVQQNQGPTIRILPATPSDSPSTHHHQAVHSYTLSSDQSSPMSPMAISPVSSATNRKQRFTMGPRSDCEKCRLGVKGHWMHFD